MRTCRVCGCTHNRPCVYTHPGLREDVLCHWVEPDLCSACEEPPEVEEPLVQVYSEGEANAFLRGARI